MNSLQYLVAQFGKRSERRYARSLILEPSEIPDGKWRVYNQKLSRSGMFRGQGESSRRAVETGSFNVLRTYSQTGATKAALIEVRQMATPSDALTEAPISRLQLKIASPSSDSSLTEATLMEPPPIAGNTSATYFEQIARSGDRRNTYRYAVDSLERVIFLTAWVTSEEESPWEEVFELSTLQADRIRLKLATERS
jgi:hypothetical protein